MKKEIVIKPTKLFYVTLFIGWIGCVPIIIQCVPLLNESIISVCILLLTLLMFVYMYAEISVGLTTIIMNQDGIIIKRGHKTKMHLWSELKLVRHERYYYSPFWNIPRTDEAVFFSSIECKKKEKTHPESYLAFKNKLDTFFVCLATPEDYKNRGSSLDSLVYPREEFLQTLGEWGVKIESKYEDMSVYLRERKEEKIEVVGNQTYIKKKGYNNWLIVTALCEYWVRYDDGSIYINNIKKEVDQSSKVFLMGIDQSIEIEGKLFHFVIKNDELRIAYQGKYMDTDEMYIPLKGELLFYIMLPFPIIAAGIGALQGEKNLFLVAFMLLGLAGWYLNIQIKKGNK